LPFFLNTKMVRPEPRGIANQADRAGILKKTDSPGWVPKFAMRQGEKTYHPPE